MANDVTKILDPLVDAWCERRAFKPLRYILPVYPMPSGTWLTDDGEMILEALKDVRGFCSDTLPPAERSELTRAMIILQDALENR